MNLQLNAFRRHFAFVVLTIFMLQLFPGCGDGRAARVPVAGVVTVDGKPLEHGSVTFMPVQSGEGTRAGGASLEAGGRFSVSSFTPHDGLMMGQYKVMVNATEPMGETAQRWHAPKKYASIETSGLTLDVSGEMKEVTFELSWEGERPSKPFVEKF